MRYSPAHGPASVQDFAASVPATGALYPAPLRDLFIRVAQAGLVRARWTETIHDEWIRNVLKDNPRLSAERLARTRTLMNANTTARFMGSWRPSAVTSVPPGVEPTDATIQPRATLRQSLQDRAAKSDAIDATLQELIPGCWRSAPTW
jgi:hypothetical protein